MNTMDILKTFKNLIEQNKNGEIKPNVTAIIVAAGKGERLGSGLNKQFIPLCDIPVLARTLSAFESSSGITRVIVVVRGEDIVAVADIVREFGFDKVVRIVRGGETRQQSAAAGLEAAGVTDYIAVHDGARPLVTSACIDRVVEAALEFKAAATAVRLKDTVKQTDENGIVLGTPDRSFLWAVQTPQVFETELYKKALKAAQDSGAEYTDDCQLVEIAGGRVRLVEGEYSNIKITTKDDVNIAEAILRARGEAF
jgi:2-C-methyl-D-erythritol 4-phosphate cytidylyltransferase